MNFVSIEELVNEFKLKVLISNVDISQKFITNAEINRPALQLTGYFEHFDSERIQIIGLVEYTYLQKTNKNTRKPHIVKMFEYKIPCLVITRNLQPFEEMIECAISKEVPLLSTDMTTSEFMSEVIRWLNVKLAPQITLHGVLVDIYGEGILITGESGIGKSETALELIKRGHRLVADDAVEIKRVSRQTLIGSCPEIIRFFIELRGIGIIDIKQMFGVESIKETQSVDLIIKLENWDNDKEYDRVGLTEEYMEVLGNSVLCHTIPVRPGRNLAIICESAAVNYRQKKMGYNAAQILNDRITKNISK